MLQREPLPLDPANGAERPLQVAVIDERLCIGCTLCIQACPVDAIVGAAKMMHTVLAADCTGCDLCLPPCPMDCIAMVPVDPPRAWTTADADAARQRFEARKTRLAREQQCRDDRLASGAPSGFDQPDGRDDPAPAEAARKQAVVQAAVERARARRRPAGSGTNR
jgi:electron transport complex protein RnfB